MRLVKISLLVVVLVLIAGGFATYFGIGPAAKPAAAPPPVRTEADTGIGCLGRIEPGNGVMRLAARSLGGQPSIVSKLLVAERDAVTTGQVVAELDSAEQLRAVAALAEARVEVARKRLLQAQAGAKPSDLSAQRAEIERIDVEIEGAQKELRRQEMLVQSQSGTELALDQARLSANTLARLRRQAVERLNSLSEIRPVDVDVAKAELEASVRDVARTRAEYNASLVHAPLDGRVLKIHAWPGEEVGSAGLMEVANTDQMYVLAEVPEGDMARVAPGQRATISGRGLPAKLMGTVERVGLQVTQNSLLKLDPTEFSDARVVEAKIRLDDGAPVAGLIHLRVNVFIDASSPADKRTQAR